MGIAKSTNEEAPRVFDSSEVSQASISGVPTVNWDILRFFDTDIQQLNSGSTEENLKEIESWVFKDAETLGDGLMKLRNLEIELGTPTNGESRITKIHRWVKMEQHINDLKLRQRAL